MYDKIRMTERLYILYIYIYSVQCTTYYKMMCYEFDCEFACTYATQYETNDVHSKYAYDGKTHDFFCASP
jgi:hypothetical protein